MSLNRITVIVAECDVDFTRFLRFPCDGSTCDVDLSALTEDCGGFTAEETGMAPEMDSSRMAVTYVCVPNSEDLGKLGELVSMPLNSAGNPTRDTSDKWPTGVRRPKLDFNPNYDTTIGW